MNGGTTRSLPLPDPNGFKRTFTPYYEEMSESSESKVIELNHDQIEILKQYFVQYLQVGFDKFIELAPTDPLDHKCLRAFMILKGLDTPKEDFQQLLSRFYPAVPEGHPDQKQNKYFRDLLSSFNKLCLKEKDVDVNHTLFAKIYDHRLSPEKRTSPSKKDGVSIKIKELTREYLAQKGYSFEIMQTDFCVLIAVSALEDIQYPFRYSRYPK